MNNDIEKELKEAQLQYDKLLKERNDLKRDNELLKKDLKYYQEIIKKGVEEHYKEFMKDYNAILDEYNELMEKYKGVKETLAILKKSIKYKESHIYVLNEKMKGQKFMQMQLSVKGDDNYNKVKEWLGNV